DTWRRAVTSGLRRIDHGELGKVVLSRRVRIVADEPFDRTAILTRLRAQQPGCFVYACDGLVGATPELLVRREGDRVTSIPLAGPATDGARLASPPKDAAEPRFVVDALESALAPHCVDLDVPDAPEVVHFADLAHLATPITGRLAAPGPSALDL